MTILTNINENFGLGWTKICGRFISKKVQGNDIFITRIRITVFIDDQAVELFHGDKLWVLLKKKCSSRKFDFRKKNENTRTWDLEKIYSVKIIAIG